MGEYKIVRDRCYMTEILLLRRKTPTQTNKTYYEVLSNLVIRKNGVLLYLFWFEEILSV